MGYKRFRATDMQKDYQAPFSSKSGYQGQQQRNNQQAGGNGNYLTNYYGTKTSAEGSPSTVRRMENEFASFRYMPDHYYPKNISAIRFNIFNTEWSGWWHPGRNPFNAELADPDSSKVWEYGIYNRNVVFVWMPDNGGFDEQHRDDYYMDKYAKDMISRGTYTRPVTCLHKDEPTWDGEKLTHQDHSKEPYPSNAEYAPYVRFRNGVVYKSGRAHPYHEFPPIAGGAWTQIIVDDFWDMHNKLHGGPSNNGWWPNPYNYWHPDRENDLFNNYFDCWRWSYTFIGNGISAYQSIAAREWDDNYEDGNISYYHGGEMFYVEEHQNDNDARWFIHGVTGSHSPLRGRNGWGEFTLGFSVFPAAKYMSEVVWSYEDMHQWDTDNPGAPECAFDNRAVSTIPTAHCYKQDGTPMWSQTGEADQGTGVMPWAFWDGLTAHPQHQYHMHFWTDAVDTDSAPFHPTYTDQKFIYFAMRPQESTWDPLDDAWGLNVGDPTYENKCGPWNPRLYRQICVPVQLDPDGPGILPPHLKGTDPA